MLAFRLFILAMIIVVSSIIGILFSKRYANREKEIKEMKNTMTSTAIAKDCIFLKATGKSV